MTEEPSIAVIVVTYNPGEHLDAFLASVPGSIDQPVRVIVSDNGSTDDSIPRARTSHPEVVIHVNDANLGYGQAVNRAVSTLTATTEWIVVVNPDVVLGPDSLGMMVRTGRSSDGIGAVGPLIRTAEGDIYPSARHLPTLGIGIGHALLANAVPDNRWSRKYRVDRSTGHTEPDDVGWLSGACLIVRGEAFRAIGGFDDRFFMYFEDVELCRQLGLAGYRNVYEPRAEVMHVGAHSTKSHSAVMERVHHESAYLYLKGVYSGWYWAPVRFVLWAGLRIRSAVRFRRATRQQGVAPAPTS